MKIRPEDHFEEELNYANKKMRSFSKVKNKAASKHKKYPIGRIIFLSPDAMHIDFEKKIYECSIKGTLKKQLKQENNRLACGDLVQFDPDKKVILFLEPRKTVLMRQNPSQRHKDQILATNIDLLLITTSTLEPALNPYLIDLYLVAAQRAKLSPVIVVNKIDLLKSKKHELSAQKEKKLLKTLKEQYKKLNIPVLEVSTVSLTGFKELKKQMKDNASVFSGESGVGKSSLINAMGENNLKVSSVSQRHKGTHTTTSSQLLPLEEGGWCVDTPGIQSFGFKNLKKEQIKHFFPEFDALNCRFSDCNHLNEEGCALKEALEKKEISPLRLDSYYRMIEELKN